MNIDNKNNALESIKNDAQVTDNKSQINEQVKSDEKNIEITPQCTEQKHKELIESQKHLEINIKELKDEIKIYKDKFLRAKAESENLSIRYQKESDSIRKYALWSFAKELISVVDNLIIASNTETNATNFSSLVSGVKITLSQLDKVFLKFDITNIEPKTGDTFDYEMHEAVSKVKNNTLPSNSILKVIQKGYKIKNRLLRPSLVSVTEKDDN